MQNDTDTLNEKLAMTAAAASLLGQDVKEIREQLQLTPCEFANKLELSLNALEKVEAGQASCKLCYKTRCGLKLLLAERMALKMTKLRKHKK